MTDARGPALIDLLYATDPDVDRIIDTFVSRFNAAYGSPEANRWDITKEEWQRYEFLGDRVLNLIIAQTLFTNCEGVLDEGEMTRILSGVVSNRALDGLSRARANKSFHRLIPCVIGEQETYGKRVTGGAFEAFIGALYCEVGLDDVTFFVGAIMKEALGCWDPNLNAVGILQEYLQGRRMPPPLYEEICREGPAHKPLFSVSVTICEGPGPAFTGSGPTLSDARQDAARKALAWVGKRKPGNPEGRS